MTWSLEVAISEDEGDPIEWATSLKDLFRNPSRQLFELLSLMVGLESLRFLSMVICEPLEVDRFLAALLARNLEAAPPEVFRIFGLSNFLRRIFKFLSRHFHLLSLFLIDQGSREMIFGDCG